MKKITTLTLLLQLIFQINCKGKNENLIIIPQTNDYSDKKIEWEKITIKNNDTIIFNKCDASNIEIIVDSKKILIQYGHEDAKYLIKEIRIKNDTTLYLTEDSTKIQSINNTSTLSTWIIPDSIRVLCAIKGIYKKEKQPFIYCQDLKDVRDIVDAKDLKKEVTITSVDDFIKTKYPSSSFHIIKKLIADANGDGIPDYIYAIHFNGNGVPQDQEEILLVLLTIDDDHFEVAIDRSDIISAATTLLDVNNGTIYFQNEMFSSRDKLGFNYLYNKDIDDWILTYVNESYDYSDFVKNYDLSSYRNLTLKYKQ